MANRKTKKGVLFARRPPIEIRDMNTKQDKAERLTCKERLANANNDMIK